MTSVVSVVGVGDGEALGVPVGAGVALLLDTGAAVAWMNGLRLWNWSSVGSCLAGSSALAPLPVEEATVEESARPAAAGFEAPVALRAVVAPPWP